MAKKTWTEKRDDGKPSQIKECPNGFADIKPGEIMLLPSARLIDRYIRNIPFGQQAVLSEIRNDMAAQAGAAKSCPVVTGIHLRVVAEAAYEDLAKEKTLSDITPIWRAIGPKSKTLKKLSFDYEFILQQREAENLSD